MKKYLRATIKSYNGNINTNFHNNKMSKEDSQIICLVVILIDSAFRAGKNYYPLHPPAQYFYKIVNTSLKKKIF